ERWGRLLAFLFIWQFLISGPLELATGFIAIAQFSDSLSPGFAEFNNAWSWEWKLGTEQGVAFGPGRLLGIGLGMLIIFMLYRRITVLGRLTMIFWLGVLATIAWILVEG